MPTKNIWITANQLTTDWLSNGIETNNGWSQAAGTDFVSFIDPANISKWADVRAATSTIKIYAYDAFNLTAQQLQAIGQFAQVNGFKLILEAGVLQPFGPNQSNGWGVEGFNGAMAAAYSHLKSAGVTLDYVAMDEGFGNALYLGYTPTQIADNTAIGLALAKSYFPNIHFGDIENIRTITPTNLTDWISAYRKATGEDLAFFQADGVYDSPSQWMNTLDGMSKILTNLGIPLDVIITAFDATSAQNWSDTALEKLIEIFQKGTINFSSLNFQSWDHFYPQNILAQNTDGTLTNLAYDSLFIPLVQGLFAANLGRPASTFEILYYTKQLSLGTLTPDRLSANFSNIIQNKALSLPVVTDQDRYIGDGITFSVSSSKSTTLLEIMNKVMFVLPEMADYTTIQLDAGSAPGMIDSGVHLNGNTHISVKIANAATNNIWLGAAGQSVTDTLGYSCTYADASMLTTATTITAGGMGELDVYKGGTIALGSNITGVKTLRLVHAAVGESNYDLTTSSSQAGMMIWSSGGNDVIRLGDNTLSVQKAEQIIQVAADGQVLIKATCFSASAIVLGNGVASTTLEVTNSGVFKLNTQDHDLTVKIDQASLCITNTSPSIIVDARVGGISVNAYGSGQIVLAGKGDSVTDLAHGGLTIRGLAGDLQNDSLHRMCASDLIDITNFKFLDTRYTMTTSGSVDHIFLANAGRSTDFYVDKSDPALVYKLADDGSGGTLFKILT